MRDASRWPVLFILLLFTATPVAAQCLPPTIVVQPQSQTVLAGHQATLDVTVTGTAPFAYQWWHTGWMTVYPITGATSRSYTTPPVTTEDAFFVAVTSECGSVTSDVATITAVQCEPPAITQQPGSISIPRGSSTTLSVTAGGTAPLAFQWYRGASGDAGNPISGATGSSYNTGVLNAESTSFWVRVTNECGHADSATAVVTTVLQCQAPTITRHPASISIPRGSSTTLSVAAGGTAPLTFQWYRGASGDAGNPITGATGSSYETGALNAPSTSFWVRVSNSCGHADSAAALVTTVCTAPAASPIQAPANVASGQSYDVEFGLDTGIAQYELQEAAVETFVGAATFTTVAKKLSFTKSVTESSRRFYRVRAIAACEAIPGPFSATVMVTVTPSPSGNELDPNASLPEGSGRPVNFTYRLAPPASGAATFTATTDRSWLLVAPAAGTIPPSGMDLTVEASPTGLPPGTSTGTLSISVGGTTGANHVRLSGTSGGTTNVPISLSLVTPVTPKPRTSESPAAFVIPVVGHAEGANNSTFLSDVRLFNRLTAQPVTYRVTFTPSGIGVSSYQTKITVAPQQTLALNDVLKTWFGLGALPNESALGVLEIRPVGVDAGTAFLATAASSRTYNITPTGTFGQFIPAIPLTSFIAAPAGGVIETISLQQLAQNDGYRTNFGMVEGIGGPAHVLVRIYSSAGALLREVTADLQPFEHRQINRFLAQNGVPTLSDGRIEVQVLSGPGHVTAYASVVDNRTNDPLLVLPIVTKNLSARRYTLPGVADFNNASASWRTDMRIFNSGPAAVSATISFQAFRVNGVLPAAVNRQVTIPAGVVAVYDNVLQSLFGLTNILGGIHVTTSSASSLVVTGRTYDLKPGGTYGQFIPAVTPEEGAGIGDGPLQLLQVEESDRFRTNVGIAEISGNPVLVELTVHAPHTLATPRKEIGLAGNEFVQFNRLLEELRVHTAYNVRVRVKVIAGNGRVTAYASVADNMTQDPTYIPAQ